MKLLLLISDCDCRAKVSENQASKEIQGRRREKNPIEWEPNQLEIGWWKLWKADNLTSSFKTLPIHRSLSIWCAFQVYTNIHSIFRELIRRNQKGRRKKCKIYLNLSSMLRMMPVDMWKGRRSVRSCIVAKINANLVPANYGLTGVNFCRSLSPSLFQHKVHNRRQQLAVPSTKNVPKGWKHIHT